MSGINGIKNKKRKIKNKCQPNIKTEKGNTKNQEERDDYAVSVPIWH